MKRKEIFSAIVAFAVALAFIMPGVATFANNKKIDIQQTTVLVDDSMSVATINSPKATSAETLNNESLTYSFSFIKPSFKDIEMDNSDYTTIQMSGCMAIGKHAGDPMLPVKSVKLLIPVVANN